MKYGIALLIASTFATTAGMGCQERGEPIPMLTQMQWRRVQEHVMTEAPEVSHPVDAVFGDQFRLIGWDIEPATPEAGEEVTIAFYWEVLEETDERWRIFVHLDSNSRQNLDHEAIGDAYPSVYWSQGEIIRDEVTARLAADIEEGDVEIFVGFFTDDDRMDVTRAGEGTIDEDGRLGVGTFSVQWEAPSYEIRRTQSEITLDGRLNEPAWRSQRYRTDNWVNPGNGDEIDGLNTWAGMVWDNDFLYIAINAIDRDVWSTFAIRDENLWEEEVVEVYFDPASNGENYIELQINPLNTVFDALFTSIREPHFSEARIWDIPGLQTAVHINGTSDDREDRDRSWSVEIQVPLTSLVGLPNMPPQNGDAFRVNFYRYDRPDADTTTTLAWSPIGGGSFHNPDRFGIARFRGNATPPVGSGEVPGSGAVPGEGTQLDIRTVNDGDSTVQIVPDIRRPRDGRTNRGEAEEEEAEEEEAEEEEAEEEEAEEEEAEEEEEDESPEAEEATNEGE